MERLFGFGECDEDVRGWSVICFFKVRKKTPVFSVDSDKVKGT